MVDTIKFSEFLDGGDLANNENTVGLGGGLNARYNNPWTFLKPGTTGDRPTPAATMYYRLRFNTTLEVYEYYDPTIPIWTQLSGSGTGTVNPGVANDLAFYAASGQAVSPIASAANAVLVSNGSNVPSMSTTLPTGLSIPGAIITSSTAALLSGSVAAAPVLGTDLTNKTYVDALVSGSVTSITGTTNQVIASSPTGAVTLSLPQDIATGSTPTFAGLTLTSIPLGISSGGTGVNTVTTAPTATSFAGWDASRNLSGNALIPGFASTVSSAGNTILTVASAQIQEITGATTHTITMPDVSTLAQGHPFAVINNSSGNVTVNSSGGNAIQVMAANTTLFMNSILTIGTTAASWNSAYVFDNGAGVLSITGTANQVIASASTGAVTLSLPQSIATTSTPTFAGLSLTNPHIAGAGGLVSFQILTSGTAATYTTPAGITKIVVEMLGGGGAGGSSAGGAGYACGGGGNAGGYGILVINSPAATYTYTVGAGGTPAAAGANNGGTGGTSSFGATFQCTGGGGGVGAANTTTQQSVGLNGAGVSTNGTINGGASFGDYGTVLNGTTGIITGGIGAVTLYGIPGVISSFNNGTAATGYGSGGGGGLSQATSRTGGAGAGGVIIVWEYS